MSILWQDGVYAEGVAGRGYVRAGVLLPVAAGRVDDERRSRLRSGSRPWPTRFGSNWSRCCSVRTPASVQLRSRYGGWTDRVNGEPPPFTVRRAGLVESERRGMNVYHRPRRESLVALCTVLDPNCCR